MFNVNLYTYEYMTLTISGTFVLLNVGGSAPHRISVLYEWMLKLLRISIRVQCSPYTSPLLWKNAVSQP